MFFQKIFSRERKIPLVKSCVRSPTWQWIWMPVLVNDEYGGTEGIITLEDLIEEIFGEIEDELDRNEFTEKKISDKEWVFSARLDVKDINRRHELSLPEDDAYETLAGLILYNLGCIPKEKETFRLGNISFTVLKTSKKRIETVSVKILN